MIDDGPPSGGSGQDGTPGRLRPTVIGPPAGRPPAARKRAGTAAPAPVPVAKATPAPATPASPRPVATPTRIPGVERKRIAVTAMAIERLSPGIAPATAAAAVRLVECFVPDAARDRDVTLWGHAAQRDYADLVSRTLALSQDDVLARVRAYVGRMIDLLGAIDLDAIDGVRPSTGMLGRLFGGARIDSARALDDARIELDQLVRLTGASLEPLLALRDAIDLQSRRIDAAGRDIEAAALAAAFLSEHLADTRPSLSRRLLERGMSLTQTLAQIRGSTPLRDSQVEQPLRLVAAIQDVVLVALPGWLGAIAALTNAAATSRRPTPTETGELQHQLRTILQQLKA